MKYFAILFASLLLSACAGTTTTLTASQCDADWANVGFADGAEGASSAKLAEYRAACANSGEPLTPADQSAWLDGHDQGLDQFCTIPGHKLSDRQISAQDRECVSTVAANEGPVTADRPRHNRRYGWRGPRISPFLSVGFGSGGTRIRSGVGIGFGLFNFGFYN